MSVTIDQFMWGYQPHFRLGVERSVRQALSQIGMMSDIRVVLVGFAQDCDQRHQICVEPEIGALSVGHLRSVVDNGIDAYRANSDSNIIITDRRSHELRHDGLRRRSRAEALGTAIEESGVFSSLTFFSSDSTTINGYDVHTCIGVPTDTLNSLPALDSSFVDQIYVGRSFQHEVISECLRRADRALYFPDPGTGLNPVGTTDDIVNTAAERFTDSTAYRVQRIGSDLYRWVNQFTSLSYERTGANGKTFDRTQWEI